METQKEITVYLSEFDYQIEQILKVYSILEERKVVFDKEPVAREMVESTGFWLHNLYSLLIFFTLCSAYLPVD